MASHEVPRQDQGDTTNMNLNNNVTVNGVTFRKGQRVVVPKAQADDIARIDYEASQERENLMRQRTFGGQV